MYHMGEGYFIHFSKLDKVFRKLCYQAVEEFYFTPNEIAVLMFLSNNPGMDSASDIARYKNISKGLVAKSVDSLSRKGFLYLEKDIEDRRLVHLMLSEDSWEVVSRLQACREAFQIKLIEGIPEKDLETLEATAKVMSKNLDNLVKG